MGKRLLLLWKVLRGDARQLWAAVRHPAAPGWLRLGVALVVLYVLSPIDLIPDWIPIVGWVDDFVVLSFAIRWLLKWLPPELARETSLQRPR